MSLTLEQLDAFGSLDTLPFSLDANWETDGICGPYPLELLDYFGDLDSVTESTLIHDGNPLLARHLDNCMLKIDSMGARIVKESRNSARKIDAAV